jgi:prepilin-type N-terminal cleavage/methylation domain-containing protein
MTRLTSKHGGAFTLIELLVVISIVVVLIGLAFPAFQGVQNSAKKTQAKNDLLQTVTAVNAFYTEYGKYPAAAGVDAYFGGGTPPTGATSGGNNDALFDVLRNNTASPNNANSVTTLNPRGIAYLQPRVVKSDAAPSAGVASNTAAAPTRAGAWYDPWGSIYAVVIDATYDNGVPNPYSDDPGGDPISTGVIAWSLGKNGLLGGGAATNTRFGKEPGTSNAYANSQDVISWQ